MDINKLETKSASCSDESSRQNLNFKFTNKTFSNMRRAAYLAKPHRTAPRRLLIRGILSETIKF